MCTLSWLRLEGGYALCFNRDERRTRAAGLPPTIQDRSGVRVLMPSDFESGGTWIGVNELGVSLCLLNRYGDLPGGGSGRVSRGLLVFSLLDCASLADLKGRVPALPLDRYEPFTLAGFEPGGSPVLFEWTGPAGSLEMTQVTAEGLVRTSSALGAEVERRRRVRFESELVVSGGVTADLLARLHRSHLPVAGPVSVCMHRDDAETVSLTRIAVTAAGVELEYTPGPPCQGAPPTRLSLHRRPDPSPLIGQPG